MFQHTGIATNNPSSNDNKLPEVSEQVNALKKRALELSEITQAFRNKLTPIYREFPDSEDKSEPMVAPSLVPLAHDLWFIENSLNASSFILTQILNSLEI